MKKILVFGCAVLFAVVASASQFRAQSFLGDSTDQGLIISNNLTVTVSSTTPMTYYPPLKTNVLCNTARYQHGTSLYTNTAFSVKTTNYAGGVVTNSQTYPPPWHPIALNVNPDGTPCNYSINAVLDLDGTADSTNLIKFTFVKSNKGTPDSATEANTFAFQTICSGATALAVTTNVPTIFAQGTESITLKNVVTSNSSTNLTVRVKRLTLNGWTP